jgi:hypothetical protein
MNNAKLESVKGVGAGLAFIVFPIVFIFAFAIHPNLFSLAIVTDVSTRIGEFHGNRLMHLGHALMLLTVPLLIVVSLKFMDILTERGAWLGFVGCVMAVFGAVMLAVDKTALCLVPSALDTLSEAQFAQMLPGLEAMFGFKGWLALLYLLPLLPIGFMIQGVGLYVGRAIPRWQSVSLVVAMVLLGVSAAVDIDLFGLVASVILAVAMLPIGMQLITESNRSRGSD